MRRKERRRLLKIMLDITVELARAESIRPDWPDDVPRQVVIVAEEAVELIRAAIDVNSGRENSIAVKDAAVRTATMAIRLLVNLEGEK